MPKSEKKTRLKKGTDSQKGKTKPKGTKKSQKGTKKAKKAQKQPKMDSRYNDLVIGLLIPGAILVTLCIVLGLFKVCYRSSHPSDPKTQLAYPVAISNRLFNVCKCLFG